MVEINEKTRLRLNTTENPFEDDSPAWHVFIDVAYSVNDNDEIVVGRMMEKYKARLSYYQCYLGELLEKNIVSIVDNPEYRNGRLI